MNNLPTDINRIQAQQSYTDLNQLNNIRQLGNDDKDLALREIAQQFESMFMQMMLKSMRAANDVFAKDNPLNSFEVNFHKDMLDNQLSLSLSQDKGMGIADALYRQLSQSYIPNSSPLNNDTVNGEKLQLNDPLRQSFPDHYKQPLDVIKQRKEDGYTLDEIKSPEDFIQAMMPHAKKVAEEMGVDPRLLIAQAALETGWGEHTIRDRYGKHSFNLFNIKADSRWEGHSVNVPTIEYREGVAEKESANFRRYESIAESFRDYQQFLEQPRYQKALTVADDSHAFIAELQNAGYATDPQYAKKVSSILDRYLLN